MRCFAPYLLTAILLCPGFAAIAQEEYSDWNPTLSLAPETDGTIWVDLYLPREPADAATVSDALALMMDEQDPEIVADIYDGADEGYAGWSDYWWGALAREGMLLRGDLNLEPLRAILGDLGYTALDVTVERLPAPVRDVRWNGPVDSAAADDAYSWATLPLDASFPAVSLAFGYTPATLLRYYLPVPVLITVLLLLIAGLRRRMLRAPDAEVGYACYTCTRTYYACMFMFWALLAYAVRRWPPFEPLEYGFEGGMPYPTLLTVLLFVALASLVTILTRVYLLPVYLRLPGATWTWRDFAAQAAWACAFLVVLAIAVGAAVSQLGTNVPHALAWLFAGIIVGVYVYLRLLMAMDIVLQALDEGDLFARAKELADVAGVSRLRGIYMMYRTKSPVLNAMAATGQRLVFTDILLRNLTRNEVDAVIGHELTHVKQKHPERLRRAQFIAYLLGVVFAVVAWVVLLIPVGLLFPFAFQDIWDLLLLAGLTLGLLFGVLLYTKVCRNFEFEADAGAVALTGDPEALITGLCKVTRLNFMPMHWRGTWAARLITHPSTYRRAERIAKVGNVPQDRLDALVAPDASVGEGHYDIPHSAGRDRVFTTQHKMRVQNLNLLSLLLVPPLLPLAYASLVHNYPVIHVPAVVGIVPLVAGSLFILLALQNRSALRGFRGLARRFRELNPTGPVETTTESAAFVGFAPNRFSDIYDGFTNWDVGLLTFDEAGLHYRGDGLRFSVTRDAIEDLSLQRRWFSLVPTYRILVTHTDTGGPCSFAMACAEASSQLQANRKSRALFAQLQHWHGGGKGLGMDPNSPYPPPPQNEVRGLGVREVFRLPVVAIFSGCIFASGFVLGVVAGLPNAEPVLASALGVGVIAGVTAMLGLGSVWLATRGSHEKEAPRR